MAISVSAINGGESPLLERVNDLLRASLYHPEYRHRNANNPSLFLNIQYKLIVGQPVIIVVGSFDPQSEWIDGILENSRYFRFRVWQEVKNSTKVSIEKLCGYKTPSCRKYSGDPEKVAQKLQKWLKESEQMEE